MVGLVTPSSSACTQKTIRSDDPETLLGTIHSGVRFFSSLQQPVSGHWAGDYGGPLFLLPGYVISAYCSGTLPTIPQENKKEITRYLLSVQRVDGGWGVHIEDTISSMFGTALNYVTLRYVSI